MPNPEGARFPWLPSRRVEKITLEYEKCAEFSE
jgi:hypothetical protein